METFIFKLLFIFCLMCILTLNKFKIFILKKLGNFKRDHKKIYGLLEIVTGFLFLAFIVFVFFMLLISILRLAGVIN